ncbi:hypothetical protein MAR_001779 [Mya arenaria]|uniref:DDE Tnp4 domain-containing protein n=1 Tax=Mya arenaria TaxID=6604 RepID=A0ABY7FGS5_MYAAR|nr:hypothetical protein MAR_001779 [Mya arenaria]
MFKGKTHPRGSVIFLSNAWGGRVSDIEITRKSDHSICQETRFDRGFTLKEDFATEWSAELILPSFTRGKKQMSTQ